MKHYAGLDVSLRATAVCVIDERGRVIIESKIPSEPDAIADFLQPYAVTLKLAGLEAGLLAPYLYNGLVEHGVPNRGARFAGQIKSRFAAEKTTPRLTRDHIQ